MDFLHAGVMTSMSLVYTHTAKFPRVTICAKNSWDDTHPMAIIVDMRSIIETCGRDLEKIKF